MRVQIGFGISVTQGYGLVIVRLPGSKTGWCARVRARFSVRCG